MKKMFLIGNAHIDPVWLWRWQEGYAEIKATFQSVLDRMEEYPDFVFTSACASYYKWVEDNAPELFKEVTKRVKEGRWEIAGGWWLQPDCNIPSGESLARHGLYSQRYFLSRFGKTAKTGYNVDSFGHNAMIPQILKLSGMDNYVFTRPMPHEKELKKDLFWWQSPDGSKVLTYRIPYSYNSSRNMERVTQKFDLVAKMSQDQDIPVMYFYGVGNHGGGPTRTLIEHFKEVMTDNKSVIFGLVDDYFENVKEFEAPVVADDLQYHASGCYSTTSKVKHLNRKAENRIVNAEKYNFIAHHLLGLEYPRSLIQRAWEDVMFNQFHDIMGGCSVREAFDDAEEFYGESLKISAEVLNNSLQKISWSIDTMGNEKFYLSKEMSGAVWEMENRGVPFVVFNPNPWPVKGPVTVTKYMKSVTDHNDNPVEFQHVRAPQTNLKSKLDTMFVADVPALGYKVYKIFLEKEFEHKESDKTLAVTENSIENHWYRIEFDKNTGWIKSFYDKQNEREILSGPGGVFVVLDDKDTDTWAHGVFSFRNEIGRFVDAKLMVYEDGPIRAGIRVFVKYGQSWIYQDFKLYRDIDTVDVSLKINWQEERKILKLSYPVNVTEAKAIYEIPYGSIFKDANGVEEAGQQWFAVCGKEGGLAIANDSKYSYDILNGEMRLTLLRSTFYADHFGEHDQFNEPMDLGIHYVNYKLIPFKDQPLKALFVKKAAELNNPFIPIIETYHKGPLPLENSFISVSKDNIIAHCLKMWEDGNDAILRFSECEGIKTEASFCFSLFNANWSCNFKPFEIKTFRVSPEGIVKEVNILEYD